MNELSIINDYDDTQLMMCEKEDLVQHINYLQGQLQGCQDELKEVEEVNEMTRKNLDMATRLVDYFKRKADDSDMRNN